MPRKQTKKQRLGCTEAGSQSQRATIAEKGFEMLYIKPGSPWQNAYSESFNSRMRDELLNVEIGSAPTVTCPTWNSPSSASAAASAVLWISPHPYPLFKSTTAIFIRTSRISFPI